MDLCRKCMPVKVRLTETCQQTLDTLKAKLLESPLLMAPDFDLFFVLQTDASEFSLGAVLLQAGSDGSLHQQEALLPRKRERNYSMVKEERLAVIWSLSKL